MRVLCRYVVKRGYRVSNWRVTPSARPRWPSVPDFLGQSRFLTTCSRKEISSPGMCICPVFGLMFRICPDLPISASVCLHISGEKLAQILSVYTKKITDVRVSAPDSAGGTRDTPPNPTVGPRRRACGAHTLWSSQILMPKLWSPSAATWTWAAIAFQWNQIVNCSKPEPPQLQRHHHWYWRDTLIECRDVTWTLLNSVCASIILWPGL